MTNFSFIRSPLQEIDESFREEGFTAIERLVQSLNIPTTGTPLTPAALEFEDLNQEQNFDILLDRGAGTISRGLKSLETMSKTLKGVSQSSLELFGTAIKASTPTAMSNANVTEARSIVLQNLGLTTIITAAAIQNQQLVDNTINLVDQIARDVKAGIFLEETYKKEVLARSKALVRASSTATSQRLGSL